MDGKFQVTAVHKKFKTQLLPNDSLYHHETGHCVKTVQIRSFLWSIFSCVQSEYRKIWTRKTPYLDTSHAVGIAVTFGFVVKLR